jgi:hypothetical protein
MRKLLVLLGLMAALSPVFGQEVYTIYCSGNILQGTCTVQQDKGGKITITPRWGLFGSWLYIDHALCPLIPTRVGRVSVTPFDLSIIIDGNTKMVTSENGVWTKTVVNGNTTMETWSDGSWTKTVVNGNTTMTTESNGSWTKTVVNGNTTMETRSDGYWIKTVVDGNTTMETWSDGRWHKTVVDGNTTMETWSSGFWHKTVVDKQGYNIFVTKDNGKL